MKYLKLFEELVSSSPAYTEIGFEKIKSAVPIRFDSKEMEILNKTFPDMIDTGFKTESGKVKIYKLSDKYLLKLSGSEERWYSCDQFEGLIHCIKYIKYG